MISNVIWLQLQQPFCSKFPDSPVPMNTGGCKKSTPDSTVSQNHHFQYYGQCLFELSRSP
uniref:Uncharacterized protein n=1 Tax=Rhizophora mucronata TaxID=61149 RepID=A0A2P2NWD4_RHIMU